MSLNGDLISEILRRVDSITLANAGCVSSEFRSIARQESKWEEACSNLWPSTRGTGVKKLISSSLGGFRNFYANCFPSIVYGSSDMYSMKNNCHESLELHTDFVSLVDVWYMDKLVFSKILWEIPSAGGFEDWFYNCPFRIDLIDYWNVENEDPTTAHGFPAVVSVDKEMREDKFWGKVMENFKLSWIVINRRTGECANLSSWRPLLGQRHSDADFVMRFGSILPAQNTLPYKDVQCILAMKIRLSGNDHGSLKIIELGMQLEDMMGGRVNGRNTLVILERALGCPKSKDYEQIFQSYEKYLSQQTKVREAKVRTEGLVDTLCTLSGVLAVVSLCYLMVGETGVI